MTTLREHHARLRTAARRRLSRFTKGGLAHTLTEVRGPVEAATGYATSVGPAEAQAARFIAAPPGVLEGSLTVPPALRAAFSLPEPEAFGRVAQAAQGLAALPAGPKTLKDI
jgi:hypothetical protein